MRCNKTKILAALGSVALLAMPVAANAQSLGIRLGANVAVGTGAVLGGVTPGLTGLTGGLTSGLTSVGSGLTGTVSGLTSGTSVGSGSLASVTIPPLATSGLVAANTGAINATVLGGGSVLSASVAPVNANVANGLVTLGTPNISANVLGNGTIANVSTGGPLVARIGNVTGPLDNGPGYVDVSVGGTGGSRGRDVTSVLRIDTESRGPGGTTTLGSDSFFSAGANTSAAIRMNGGGGGGSAGGSNGAEASAESSAQICERVLRRPGSYQRNVVAQCRRVVASLVTRR